MKKSLLIFALFGLLASSVYHAQAQVAPRVYVQRTGQFGIQVLIDSTEPINAYNVEIAYNPAVVEIESLDTSRSLVTVLPQPIVAREGRIVIKGGSTVPFSGTGGELLTVLTKPIAEGTAEFVILSSVAYRADGSGAPLETARQPLAVRVTPATFTAYEQARVLEQSGGDQNPPSIDLVSIEENPINYGERVVVFTASDAESGVARYEARDRFWFTWSAWREAVNPYPMTAGAWAVQIKAVDNSGNVALATVYQLGNALWKFGLLAVIVLVAAWGLLTARRRQM